MFLSECTGVYKCVTGALQVYVCYRCTGLCVHVCYRCVCVTGVLQVYMCVTVLRVHLRVELHVGLLLMVVPQLLGSLWFLRQVGFLPLLDQLWVVFPEGQLTLAVLMLTPHATFHQLAVC